MTHNRGGPSPQGGIIQNYYALLANIHSEAKTQINKQTYTYKLKVKSKSKTQLVEKFGRGGKVVTEAYHISVV